MKTYKCLGVAENHKKQHKNEKEMLKTEYVRGLSLILSAENKTQAAGSLAAPVLRHSFGIINWHQEEI
jgi:hypothetical protein